jgi:predicted nucleotide-binding protein
MKTVLIVDDDYATASSIASYLLADGFEVNVAHSLEQAIAILEAADCPLDVALIDILLPERADDKGLQFEGFNLAERLRQASPTTTLIAISAYMPPDRIQALSGAFDACLSKLTTAPHEIGGFLRQVAEEQKPRQRPSIFIVHGHDDVSKLALKNYLQNILGLGEPVILHEQPSHGRTIIEKLEAHARRADLVFVLLTPDDVGATSSNVGGSRPRSRQNVIFEMGFFLAKLQRTSGRVILLHKGELELPSDISGVVYIDISDGIEAVGEGIRRELASWL